MNKLLKKSELIRVFSFMKPRIITYFISQIMMSVMLTFCLNTVMAIVLKDALNSVVYKDFSMLKRAALLAAGSFFIGMPVMCAFYYLKVWCVKKTMKEIRSYAFNKMVDLELKHFESQHSGDLITRMSENVFEFERIYLVKINQIVSAFVDGIFAFVFIFYIEWRVGLVILLTGIINVLIGVFTKNHTRKLNNAIQERQKDLTVKLVEILNGMAEIKMFCIENIINKTIPR